MSMQDLEKSVKKKISYLRQRNVEHKNNGSMISYRDNCNQLAGIDWVMQRVRKLL